MTVAVAIIVASLVLAAGLVLATHLLASAIRSALPTFAESRASDSPAINFVLGPPAEPEEAVEMVFEEEL